MSRGVGEKAAKKLGESEQREASPNAGDAWKTRRRFITIVFESSHSHGVWVFDLLYFWAGGSKASRTFGRILMLHFFFQVN